MSQPITLPDAFMGMYQDAPRDRLPKDKAWNLVDYLPSILGAPVAQRGGWAYASAPLSDYDASATYAVSGLYAPFSAGGQLLAITDNTHLIKITSTSSGVDKGAAVKPKQLPLFFHDLVIIPSPDGTANVYKYDGSASAASLTAAPTGQYGAVYGNRVWLGHTAAQPQRIYASDISDATTWDTTESFFDVQAPITAVAALPSVLIVWTEEHAVQFQGSSPPPQADMSQKEPIFQFGCTDARSVAVNGSYAVFANPNGVFLTNGTAFPTDVTLATGLKQYWLSLMSTYDKTSWIISSGWYGNYILVTVMNGTSFVDGFIFDMRQSAGMRISNIKASMLFPSVGASQELYVASRTSPRVVSLSSMFSNPGSTHKNDADGTAVTPTIEWPFYDMSKKFGSQRWKNAYLEYDLRDAASDNPTMTLSYCTSPEAGASYTTLSPTLIETLTKSVMRCPIRKASRGLGFKATRANAASAARIFSLAADADDRQGSRLN